MSYRYHQLLKYVYLEGYANSYEEAEYILEQLNDEEFDELCENVFRSRDTGAVNADADERAAEMHKTVSGASHTSSENRKRHRDAAAQHLVSARRKRRKAKTNEEYVIDYLVTEGYTDNYDSAIAIYESMSEEWLDTILEVTGGGKVTTDNYRERGMKHPPYMKTYMKKVSVENEIENRERRIRANTGAEHDDGYPPDPDEDEDFRGGRRPSRRESQDQKRRNRLATHLIGNSPTIKKLKTRWKKLNRVDQRNG